MNDSRERNEEEHGLPESVYQVENAYLKSSVMTADPSQLVLLLYDEIRKQLNVVLTMARSAPDGGEQVLGGAEAIQRLDRCRAILAHLIQSVNPQTGEIAENLTSLYLYFLRELVGVMGDKDVQRLEDILPLLGTLREGWAEMVSSKENS